MSFGGDLAPDPVRATTADEFPGGWTRKEGLLTLSLLFDGETRGSVNAAQLLELGELIGRSPGSISFKVAGYRALRGGESPRTRRVSSVQRELYREYWSHPGELLRESEALRAELLRQLPSARIEGDATRFPTAQALRLMADGSAFPWSGCHPFNHGQGRVRGLAISSADVLARPHEAQRFFRECCKNPEGGLRRSEGFRRVERGDLEGFARGVIRWKFPTLHLKEIAGEGATVFRQVLVRPEIHRLVVTSEDIRRMTRDEARTSRERIRELLALDPGPLCPTCTLLVDYIAHQVERKLGSVVHFGDGT